MKYTKVIMDDWDIRLLVAIISWMAKQICTIEFTLESTHQFVHNDI